MRAQLGPTHVDLHFVSIKLPAVGVSERGDLRLGTNSGASMPSGTPPLWSGWASRPVRAEGMRQAARALGVRQGKGFGTRHPTPDMWA